MTDPLTIRRATKAEAPLLSNLAYAAKRHWGYPESWLDSWSDQLTFAPDYIAAGQVFVAADFDEKPVACYAILDDGTEAYLDHFWVHPDCFGRGIGRSMFMHALETLRELGYEGILIDSDPNAEGFYKRMGARHIGTARADVCGVKRVLPRLCVQLERDESPRLTE